MGKLKDKGSAGVRDGSEPLGGGAGQLLSLLGPLLGCAGRLPYAGGGVGALVPVFFLSISTRFGWNQLRGKKGKLG